MDREKKDRIERLVYLAMCTAMLVSARVFFPTSPSMAGRHTIMFTLLGAYFLVGILVPGMGEKIKTIPGSVRWILSLVIVVSFMFLSFRILAFSLGTLAVFSLKYFLAVFAFDAVALLYLLAVVLFKNNWQRFTRVALSTTVLLNALILVPVSMSAWWPPSAGECESCLEDDLVTALTPLDAGNTLSTPYDLIYIPEKQLLSVSFKMIGNHMYSFWNRPEANRLVVLDMENPDEVKSGEISLAAPLLAECMDWNPDDGLLYVTRVGHGKHSVIAADISEYPEMKVAWEKEIPFEPNGIVYDGETRTLVVTGIEGAVTFRDPVDFEETEALQVPISAGVNSIDTYGMDGSRKIFLAMIGRKIVSIDPDSRELSMSDGVFGGGQLAEGRKAEVYQTGLLFNSLSVIDSKKMELIKWVKLGYKPRPVLFDKSRNVLMIGEWTGGYIHFHDPETMKEIRPPVRVGRYIRNFAFDEERGLLFCACLCGVYMVDVGEALGKKPKRINHRTHDFE